jgi:hypothetical protein
MFDTIEAEHLALLVTLKRARNVNENRLVFDVGEKRTFHCLEIEPGICSHVAGHFCSLHHRWLNILWPIQFWSGLVYTHNTALCDWIHSATGHKVRDAEGEEWRPCCYWIRYYHSLALLWTGSILVGYRISRNAGFLLLRSRDNQCPSDSLFEEGTI